LTFVAHSGAITDRQSGSTWNIFGTAIDGPLKGTELREVDNHDSFWFDWAAFHPETDVWSSGS